MRIRTAQAHAIFDAIERAGLLVDPEGSSRRHFFMELSVLGHKRWSRGPLTLMNEWARKVPRLTSASQDDRLDAVNAEISQIMLSS
ncbi:MAG: hypothetical protein EOP83_16190 [Verrucomicrobiaceae bacterium]|nr:MAG: hypothetical protein EOP83_16190 [Verrucomicrobiaceae bacterium]